MRLFAAIVAITVCACGQVLGVGDFQAGEGQGGAGSGATGSTADGPSPTATVDTSAATTTSTSSGGPCAGYAPECVASPNAFGTASCSKGSIGQCGSNGWNYCACVTPAGGANQQPLLFLDPPQRTGGLLNRVTLFAPAMGQPYTLSIDGVCLKPQSACMPTSLDCTPGWYLFGFDNISNLVPSATHTLVVFAGDTAGTCMAGAAVPFKLNYSSQ